MLKRVLLAALCIVAISALVIAGDMTKPSTAPSMEAMKAEFMKCYVCKNIASQMDAIGPTGMEAVKLNDGVAIRHWVESNDPKRIAAFHSACAAASKAGEECMAFSDERAKTDLCEFCQSIRTAVKAGAHLSEGQTPAGDMMVLTSSDATVQTQLSDMQKKCAMMAASMAPPTSKTTASKE